MVVAIVGILAALAVSFMPRFTRRAGLRSSTFDLIAAIQLAKTQSAQAGRDVVLVVMGPAGDPANCTRSVRNPDCVRWWMLEDVVANAGTPECKAAVDCLPFSAATLAAFDPANPSAGGPDAGGDLVVDSGALDRSVTLGRPAGAPATLGRPLANVDLSRACSFCTATAPLRGYVKFASDGTASLSALAAGRSGGAVFLEGGSETDEWRGIAITVPAGIVSTRLWAMR